YPGRIQIDSLDSTEDKPKEVIDNHDDFFSDWNAGPKISEPVKPISATTTPGITRPSTPKSPSIIKAEPSPEIKPSSTAPAPIQAVEVTVAEKSAVASVISKPATSSPVTVSSGAGGASILKSNKKGLGAKKATKVINFDEAERKAKEEEELKRKLIEEELKRKEEEEKNDIFNNPLGTTTTSTTSFSSRLAFNDGSNNFPAGSADKSGNSQDEIMDRLGMGFGKVGFGVTEPPKKATSGFGSTSAPKTGFGGGFGNTPSPTPNESSEAAQRFGKAKAISSDQYFNRGGYDEAASNEARDKLRGFQGRSGFGSDDYHGRPTETTSSSSAGYGGFVANSNVDAMLGQAREFAMKFAGQAAEDINSLNQIVRSSGQKL
ncbi:ADP-ribosylation factor GTPase activating protein, ER-Golgi transport, partial [Nowakowskiella sp. JEL0078]